MTTQEPKSYMSEEDYREWISSQSKAIKASSNVEEKINPYANTAQGIKGLQGWLGSMPTQGQNVMLKFVLQDNRRIPAGVLVKLNPGLLG